MDTEDEALDAGSTMGEGAGTGSAPAGGAVRDASKPPATTPATTPAARNDAGSTTKPSTSTPAPTGGTSTKDAATASTGGGDAGAKPSEPAPRDAGAVSMPSGGATCAAAAGYPTTDACSQCICAKCSAQVKACYASDDAAKNSQCGQVQACAEKNHCASSVCYCGDALLCLGTPRGACVSAIETAAGTQDTLEILRASDDPENPVGRANNIGLCSRESCTRECGL